MGQIQLFNHITGCTQMIISLSCRWQYYKNYYYYLLVYLFFVCYASLSISAFYHLLITTSKKESLHRKYLLLIITIFTINNNGCLHQTDNNKDEDNSRKNQTHKILHIKLHLKNSDRWFDPYWRVVIHRNILSVDDKICAPSRGLSTLVKEFTAATCIMQSSSNESSTLLSGKAKM